MTKRGSSIPLVAVLILTGLLLPAAPASATPITYVVNSTADDLDGGGCQVAPDDCTLREAITAANASPGLDKIQFALGSGVPTITVATTLPPITDRVNLNGNTGGASRVQISGPPGVNSLDGLMISGPGADASVVRKLVINHFGDIQLWVFDATDVVLTGNWIGTDETGLAVDDGGQYGIVIEESSSATVGGRTPGMRNVVVGTSLAGILVVSAGDNGFNILNGNYIGVNRDGVGHLGSLGLGIHIVSSTADSIFASIIGGNQGAGVSLGNDALGTLVSNSRIGIDALGNPVPNGVGILATGTAQSTFQLLEVDHNDFLGIDLGGDGVTPNDNADADTGPNGLTNFPVITRADNLESTTLIRGRVRISSPNSFITISLYASPACDPSGYGEGDHRVGAASMQTDAEGRAVFSVETTELVPAGHVVTATTDGPFGTSEFSACEVVTP